MLAFLCASFRIMDMEKDDKDNPKNKREEFCNLLTDRAQKLTGAMYRVTDLLSDKEPLKWTLRERAINLLNNLMSVISPVANLRDKDIVFEEIKNSISQLSKILELTSAGTYTTSFNFDVLKKEYNNLQAAIEGERGLLFAEPVLLLEETKSYQKEEEKIITDTKRTEETKGHHGQTPTKKEPVAAPKPVVHHNNSSRPERVINFLRNNNNCTIKEIATIFEGISEKTVQRDLLELVRIGKIAAKGEKRWRTYSLIP